jgi:hypothetical protein
VKALEHALAPRVPLRQRFVGAARPPGSIIPAAVLGLTSIYLSAVKHRRQKASLPPSQL